MATGVYSRIGSVVRWAIGPNKGQIVKHLKSIDLLATEQAQGVGVKALQFVKQHKKGTIIAVAGAATVGTGVWVYNKVKNLESKVVKEFRAALRVYIEAIRNGKMDVEKINNLMDRLDALKAHKDYSKISIQLTTEELEILVGQIYDYTIRLTEDNNISLTDEERIFSKSKSSDSIINLQSYLRTQKRIFEEVA